MCLYKWRPAALYISQHTLLRPGARYTLANVRVFNTYIGDCACDTQQTERASYWKLTPCDQPHVASPDVYASWYFYLWTELNPLYFDVADSDTLLIGARLHRQPDSLNGMDLPHRLVTTPSVRGQAFDSVPLTEGMVTSLITTNN